MIDHSSLAPMRDSWSAAAAYLYTLDLDATALAWEYLRRHPRFQDDWRRHRGAAGSHAASFESWGLRMR